MKKPPSKNDLRERLQRQTAAFLSSGGKVEKGLKGGGVPTTEEKYPLLHLFFEARQPPPERPTELSPPRCAPRQNALGPKSSGVAPPGRRQVVSMTLGSRYASFGLRNDSTGCELTHQISGAPLTLPKLRGETPPITLDTLRTQHDRPRGND
ncbi:MAG: hypothetical protein CM15mP84_09350 [Cellvibrionales bacterium]|nr:MAG: hypothetical protein CM15mP84_09350 [Cellvibrionales bacterium]